MPEATIEWIQRRNAKQFPGALVRPRDPGLTIAGAAVPETEGRRRLRAWPRERTEIQRSREGSLRVVYPSAGVYADALEAVARTWGWTIEETCAEVGLTLDAPPCHEDGRTLREWIERKLQRIERGVERQPRTLRSLLPWYEKLRLRVDATWGPRG